MSALSKLHVNISLSRNAIVNGASEKFYQIYECEFGQENGNLISCCRYRLSDKRLKESCSSTLFILLVHLPKRYLKSNFASFQERPWICYHIDDLLPFENSVTILDLVNGRKQSLSDLFHNDNVVTPSMNLPQESEAMLPLDFQLLPCDETRLHKPTNICRRLHLYINRVVSELGLSQSEHKIYLLSELLNINGISEGIRI